MWGRSTALLLQGADGAHTGNPRKVLNRKALAGRPHHPGPHTGGQEAAANYAVEERTQKVGKWQAATGTRRTGARGVPLQAEVSVPWAHHGRTGTEVTSSSTMGGCHQGEGPDAGIWVFW